MKKITLVLFLAYSFFAVANFSNANAVNPVKPKKNKSATLIPANDNCENAIAITTFPYSNIQTDGADAAADGIVEACLNWEMNDGLWYTVVGNGNNIEITVTTDEDYDIAIGVFRGSCGALVCVETVDDVFFGEEFLVIPSSEIGTVYYINIGSYDGYEDLPEGNFTIEVNSVVSPPLADCSSGAVFPSDNQTDVAVGYTEFEWEAPTTGGTVDSYDLYLGLTTPLTQDDFIGNFVGNSAFVSIPTYDTVFYWKAVPRNAGGQASDCIEWTFTTIAAPAIPENDACSTATEVTVFPFSDDIDATSATNNDGFISAGNCGTMNDGIWYKVVGNGENITISATSFDWDGKLAVYTGTCGNFTCYDSVDAELADYAEVLTITSSVIGTAYYINFGYFDAVDKAEGPAIIEITSDVLNVDENQFKSFVVYPNPVKDLLNLSLGEKIFNVEIYNLLGQRMVTKTVDAAQVQMDLSDLSSGSYLVKVVSEKETKTIKVLKQ